MYARIEAVIRWYRASAVVLLMLGCLGELLTLLARNFLNVEPDWTVEIDTLLLVFGSLLFVGEAQSHIAFTGFAGAASRRFPWMPKIAAAISGIVMGALIVLGGQVVLQQWAIGSGTALSVNIPLWFIYLVVPVSALFGLLRSIQNFIAGSPR